MHSALRFTGESPRQLAPAPELGSGTMTILSELLNYDETRIAQLAEEEAIGIGPNNP